MDANTTSSCSNFAGLQSRFKAGAKAGKAATNDQRLQPPANFEPPQTLHCHRSCAAFTNSPCAQPKACEQKRLDMAACPIKEAFGHHDCGFTDEVTEDQLAKVNLTREIPLQKILWIGDNIHMLVSEPHDRVMEPRKTR